MELPNSEPRTQPKTTHEVEDGFTLVEILVVIGIISMLIVALTPSLRNAILGGQEAETTGRATKLQTMILAYKDIHGQHPPDDGSTFGNRQKNWDLGKGNGKNGGIESLILHLANTPKSGDLSQNVDWFANTDGDKLAKDIPGLGRSERVEIVDAWGTPFAYFSGRVGSDYSGKDTVVGREIADEPGLEMTVRPWKDDSGEYRNPRGFQLISAGPDQEFDTEDDLFYPRQ
ncbi:MAG: type II secretion system protein [Planctomycetota bacterium]